MTARPFELPVHYWLSEPELIFDPESAEARDIHPLRGLTTFGPYSEQTLGTSIQPLRIACVCADSQTHLFDRCLKELAAVHQPRERREYLPEFSGFESIFKTKIVPASSNCIVNLSPALDAELRTSSEPHVALAGSLTRALSALVPLRTEFDVVLLVLPDRWSELFHGPAGDSFDLHDYLKGVSAARGLPLQILLESRAFQYPCRCSVMWRLSIALYCKAGGVPWKLASSEKDTAYIGVSYSLKLSKDSRPRHVVCCSQVFDADGSGLEFIAYPVRDQDVQMERDNPFLTRQEMRRLMARTLALYQRRHAGLAPKQVIVHKSTEFKKGEVEGCFDAWGNAERIELIQVQQHVGWRGIAIDAPTSKGRKGTPARFPCRRGTFLQLDGHNVLLWTQGTVPLAGGRSFYKEGKGIPAPLLLRRFAGHGPLDSACAGVLGLTKMNWNHDGIYDRLPATMACASILARSVKSMPEVAPTPYQFRYLM